MQLRFSIAIYLDIQHSASDTSSIAVQNTTPSGTAPPIVAAIIEEARKRARRRHLLILAAACVAVAFAVFMFNGGNGGGGVSPVSPPGEAAVATKEQLRASMNSGPPGLAAAQRKFDPKDDPGIVLRQKPNGSWTAFNIDSVDEIPAWVRTSEDLSRLDIEEQIESGELPPNVDVEALIQEREAQIDCLFTIVPEDGAKATASDCIGS